MISRHASAENLEIAIETLEQAYSLPEHHTCEKVGSLNVCPFAPPGEDCAYEAIHAELVQTHRMISTGAAITSWQEEAGANGPIGEFTTKGIRYRLERYQHHEFHSMLSPVMQTRARIVQLDPPFNFNRPGNVIVDSLHRNTTLTEASAMLLNLQPTTLALEPKAPSRPVTLSDMVMTAREIEESRKVDSFEPERQRLTAQLALAKELLRGALSSDY